MVNYKRSRGNSPDIGKKKPRKKVVLSYEHLDVSQGQTIKQWGKEGLCENLMEITAVLNKLTVNEAILTEKIIVKYNNIKLDNHNMPQCSNWKYPRNLEKKDVKWCKIRLGSTVRVIGYLEENCFYVIFLDKDHQFYPTEPKNT